MREASPSWCDVRAVDRVVTACARRKRSRPDAVTFRMRHGEEVLSLAARLQSGRYPPEPGWVFVTDQPKPLRWIHRGRRWCAAVPWMGMNRVLRQSLARKRAVAVALEQAGREGNVRARRLACIVRQDWVSGFRTSRRNP